MFAFRKLTNKYEAIYNVRNRVYFTGIIIERRHILIMKKIIGLLLTMFLFLSPQSVHANENVDIDEVSIDFEDEKNIDEAIRNFNLSVEDQNSKKGSSKILKANEDSSLVITPLTGKMIKKVMLNHDIVDAIAKEVDLDFKDAYIYYESLTESGQVAVFSELDGEYQINQVTLVNDGTLSVDLDTVYKVINDNNLSKDSVYYIMTGYHSDLTFVYFEEIDKFIPFYGSERHLPGVVPEKMYSRAELKTIFADYLKSIEGANMIPDEEVIVGGINYSNKSLNDVKLWFPVLLSIVAGGVSYLVFFRTKRQVN